MHGLQTLLEYFSRGSSVSGKARPYTRIETTAVDEILLI